jgi:DNA-binding response OmpR family regulator
MDSKMQLKEIVLLDRHVLIIEDEFILSMLLEDMLANLGCHVIGTASRLSEGLQKARSLWMDLAILDVNLNGMLSFEIAEILRARGIGLVFSTGYGSHGVPGCFKNIPILQKPFCQKELEDAMRAALLIDGVESATPGRGEKLTAI